MNVFGVLTRIYLKTTTASYTSPTQIKNAAEQLAITPEEVSRMMYMHTFSSKTFFYLRNQSLS